MIKYIFCNKHFSFFDVIIMSVASALLVNDHYIVWFIVLVVGSAISTIVEMFYKIKEGK